MEEEMKMKDGRGQKEDETNMGLVQNKVEDKVQ